MAISTPKPKTRAAWPVKDMVYDLFQSQRWTEDSYLAVSEISNYPLELSEGRLVVREMPTPQHQQIVFDLGRILQSWLTEHRLGRVYLAPMPVRLWPGKFREPDVMLYKTEHLDRVDEKYGGVPDLIIEVLSPRMQSVDLGEKFQEYAQAGVSEYWTVEPRQKRIQVFSLRRNDLELVETFTAGDRVRSPLLPGLEFALDELFASR